MFTDVLNLPLNSDRANRADQILTLNNMSWSDYQQLVATDIRNTKQYLFTQTFFQLFNYIY
jgi:hypothetical protein